MLDNPQHVACMVHGDLLDGKGGNVFLFTSTCACIYFEMPEYQTDTGISFFKEAKCTF